MDRVKIGKFIAKLRKERHLTQLQLAQELGISDKTVSKWERGGGLPEVTLLLSLGEALGISVNEILSGERLPYQRNTQRIKDEKENGGCGKKAVGGKRFMQRIQKRRRRMSCRRSRAFRY